MEKRPRSFGAIGRPQLVSCIVTWYMLPVSLMLSPNETSWLYVLLSVGPDGCGAWGTGLSGGAEVRASLRMASQ